MKQKKKFLITGHARSGTQYMAKLFQAFGFDIQHERMGKDGISSWLFACDAYQGCTDKTLRYPDYEFEYIIHVIRNPVKIVASVGYTEQEMYKWKQQFISIPSMEPVMHGVHSLLNWTDLLYKNRKIDVVIHVENAVEELKQFFDKNNIIYDKNINEPEKNVGTRLHDNITLSQIKNIVDYDTYIEFLLFCDKYGYIKIT